MYIHILYIYTYIHRLLTDRCLITQPLLRLRPTVTTPAGSSLMGGGERTYGGVKDRVS